MWCAPTQDDGDLQVAAEKAQAANDYFRGIPGVRSAAHHQNIANRASGAATIQ
jgi:hypothetical protein